VTFDGRGNGRSDRPDEGYTTGDFAIDALAVLDELELQRVILVGYSAGGRWGCQLAAEYPERVDRLVLIAPAIRLEGAARANLDAFLSEPPDREGWNKYNAVHWREQYRDFVEWFVGEIFSEPHSTKPFDDFVDWADGITPKHLVATTVESVTPRMAELVRAVRCPTLIIHGDHDAIIPFATSHRIQEAIPGSELVILEGSGHGPHVRDPVKVNLLVHDFLTRQQRHVHVEGTADARA
jgi:pimeloyl-ACP methyl ester carboxylesterase